MQNIAQQMPTSQANTSNLVPAEWIQAAQFACKAPARCDVLVKQGHRGAALCLHSETPEQIIEGDDGPAVLAHEFWGRCLEHRAEQAEGRFLYMLLIVPHGNEAEAEVFETSWTEIKADQVAEMAEDASSSGGANLAWKMVIQLHNLQMRHWSGMASIFEKLGQAGTMQIEAAQKAIQFQEAGAMKALEAERGQYDLERDQMEMEHYSKLFMQWLEHMQQAKAMNTPGETITPPATVKEAAATLRGSLTIDQVEALRELLGEDVAGDALAGLSAAAKAEAEAEAEAIARTILMRLAPYQEQLARLFAPPIVPQNIGALQSACLRVLARSMPMH